MPSWASSLIQKTEVLRTTLSQTRAGGLSGKPVLTHLLQRPMGGQDGTPLGAPPSSSGLSTHASSTSQHPMVETGIASLFCMRPRREESLESHCGTEQAVLWLFEMLQGASVWWIHRH